MANLEHAHFRQAADESHNGKAIAVGVSALVIFLIGILWSWLILRGRTHRTDPEAALPAPPPPDKSVGMIFQYMFDPDVTGPPRPAEESRRLDGWEWADRPRNMVYMPVSKAIERYLQNQPKGRDDD